MNALKLLISLLLSVLISVSGFAQLWYLTRGIEGQDERAWGVDADENGSYLLSMYDLTGWQVLRMENVTGSRINIPAGHLAKGIYLVVLEGESRELLTTRVVLF